MVILPPDAIGAFHSGGSWGLWLSWPLPFYVQVGFVDLVVTIPPSTVGSGGSTSHWCCGRWLVGEYAAAWSLGMPWVGEEKG